MSIIVKGINMPEEGEFIHVRIYGRNGEVTIEDCEGYEWTVGKAVHVPPHGRLIDADALEKEHMKRAYENFRSYQFHVSATAWINEAPTIIPAEEE